MDDNTITILFLGDEGCGKSTFLSRISQGRQNLEGIVPIRLLRDLNQPFVFDIRSRRGQFRFEFYDTSSPESWRLIQPDLVVVCFDISQRLSLINLQRVWIKEVRTTFRSNDTTPLLVLGLKRDLRSEDDPNGIIYPQEAYQVAQEMRADKYMECSAVTGELLVEVFDDICANAIRSTTEGGGQSEDGCTAM
ncbi:P-loop containing nucleoside triphosphate hydrolase protein [Lasiosphaeria miniovina]|uniref:P-loop containing nucleoside triphosphate hydrolase protein n=1 Tax=Lasiosphaeria miniovina TaxID=1954250 RepID=A0AA39ZZD6_9PEZI|nr:P-loop containing nucleoside triphosphate hydrolase protein [Lasiosphaeria miniovina]KAK0706450.1 P-loop containing nucleoside triphosphate hydrolase protein [Lasiosphaeria miniovina]